MSTASAQVSPAGFEQLYGFELVELGEERALAGVVVREELKHPSGVVHGGVYAAIAESLVSIATARALASDGRTVAPLSSQISFLRPIRNGAIHAVAIASHRGRTTWVWEVEIADDDGVLCAAIRMTVAIGRA